jgi:LysR family transcriptional regulator, nod-box dependent transcriptional activator
MRFQGLDLNLLVALEALMDEQSVTAASRRLNLSQSALSAAIGRLRRYFDDDLFTMVGRRMVPTPLALSLHAAARDVLFRVQTNLTARPEFDPASSTRRFRLIVSDYASIVLMNEVLRRAYRDAPSIRFELMPQDDQADDPLQRGEVDFIIFPHRDLSDDHPSQELFADEFCCVVWNESRKVGKRLSAARYLELGHVAAEFGPGRRISYEERALRQLGYERRIEVVVQSFSMMAAVVVGTDRVATMHRRLATIFADQLPLRLLPMPIAIPAFREGLQWPSPLDSDPASIWLRGLIGEVANGLA